MRLTKIGFDTPAVVFLQAGVELSALTLAPIDVAPRSAKIFPSRALAEYSDKELY
jgi:hypothetical protein